MSFIPVFSIWRKLLFHFAFKQSTVKIDWSKKKSLITGGDLVMIKNRWCHSVAPDDSP